MNVLSLFGGIECGYPAFLDNNIKIENYYSCEIDKYAKAITRYNIPNVIDLGDVTKVDFFKLENIDIVIGGSPCTYWSIAKKDRETTSEGIGYELFMHFVRAVKETGCRYFLYENNFSIHKDIKDAITKELGVELITINSGLVSAQNRKRCYWTNIPNITEPNDLNLSLSDIIEDNVDIKYTVNNTALEKYIKNGKPKGFKILTEKSNTVTASVHKGYGNDSCTVIRVGHFNKGGQGDRVYSSNGKSVTLSANGGGIGAKTGLYEIGEDVRRLTPLEAERLQTLPENWTKFGLNEKGEVFEVSDTQRYKCIGNGWTRKVITHILSFIPNVH